MTTTNNQTSTGRADADGDTVLRYEPLTQANLDMLFRTLRPIEAMVIRLGDTDLSRGAGVLSGNRKCVWTKDAHRITFTMISGGGFLSSLSKEPDLTAPEATNG
jgi:hypothetical protein